MTNVVCLNNRFLLTVEQTPDFTPSLNCSFDGGYWCGYGDSTPGTKVWFRSLSYDTDGGYNSGAFNGVEFNGVKFCIHSLNISEIL